MTMSPTISEGATGPRCRVGVAASCPSDPELRSDDIFGPVTKTAVEQFMRNGLLTVDAIVRPAVWVTLGGDGAGPPLAAGSHGPVVAKLQTALYEDRDDFALGSDLMLAAEDIQASRHARLGSRMRSSSRRSLEPTGRLGKPHVPECVTQSSSPNLFADLTLLS